MLKVICIIRFIQNDDMDLFVSGPAALDPDVYDSNHDGYRYSRYTCSAETSISCPQPRSLVFLPSLLLCR
jgi:hypothetical protein